MFLSALQPPIISLFSSTGDTPLALFSSSRDTALPADSFSCLLNDATSLPQPAEQCALISPPVLERVSDDAESTANSGTGYSLANTVLHIQSPTLRTTYVRCPPTSGDGQVLGIKHPWIHFQIRSLGREFSLEVGVVDKSGKEGIVRCSTFQVHFCSSFCRMACVKLLFNALSLMGGFTNALSLVSESTHPQTSESSDPSPSIGFSAIVFPTTHGVEYHQPQPANTSPQLLFGLTGQR